jgi:hypothetical protein
MSYSVSTLLTRNLHDVFGENDPERRRAAMDEIFTEDCVFYDPSRASTVAATRSIASRARSRPLTLTFDINPLPGPRNRAMAGGSRPSDMEETDRSLQRPQKKSYRNPFRTYLSRCSSTASMGARSL